MRPLIAVALVLSGCSPIKNFADCMKICKPMAVKNFDINTVNGRISKVSCECEEEIKEPPEPGSDERDV